jgi:elongation factor P
MATTMDLRQGTAVMYNHNPYLIVFSQFVNPGKGSAFTRAKMRNLKNGQMLEVTFKSGEALELVDMQHIKCQYLYNDGKSYYFMNNETYEQFSLDTDLLGDYVKYLRDGTECYALSIDGTVVSIQLPPKMDFKVLSTPPRSRGNTATTDTKEAELGNGLVVKVPAFIEEGEMIRVNTEDGSYVGKAA